MPAVLEFDPVGVICIYRVVLACGHTINYQTKTNYVPKRMKCTKCNQLGRHKQTDLNFWGNIKKKLKGKK